MLARIRNRLSKLDMMVVDLDVFQGVHASAHEHAHGVCVCACVCVCVCVCVRARMHVVYLLQATVCCYWYPNPVDDRSTGGGSFA